MEIKLGVIGGSGLYRMEGLKNVRNVKISTPFGEPSDEYITGELEGRGVVFLPRHGRGHTIKPSDINFRANIYGFKKLGVERIISMSAVGSMKEEIAPGTMVLVDQFFDNTKKRISTFFGEGAVVHIGFALPTCPQLADAIYRTAKKAGIAMRRGGTYLCMEGPQFSTRGESDIYRKWGVDVIGMTNMPEAKLAREAEICYSTVALVTDYDCWREAEESVTVDMIIKRLNSMNAAAQSVIRNVVSLPGEKRTCSCAKALENAFITPKELIPEKVKKDLDIIIGKYL